SWAPETTDYPPIATGRPFQIDALKARVERAPWDRVAPAPFGVGGRKKGNGRRTSAPRCLMAQFVVCPREPPAQLHCPQKSCRRVGTKAPLSYSRHKARDRTVGPGEVRRSMGMRRLPVVSLDPMKFLQAFAAGLRAEFVDVACAPVPEYLAALMRQLDGDRDGDRNEHSGEGREYGTGSTESASGVDCRGRLRTARVRGEAA